MIFAPHLLLVGLGVVWLTREFTMSTHAQFIAAPAFILAAPNFCQLASGHLSAVATMAWTGFAFAAVAATARGRWRATLPVLPLVLALQLLAGHARLFFSNTIGWPLYALWLIIAAARSGNRHTALQLTGVSVTGMLLALGLSAVQLLPMQELARQSTRQAASLAMCAAFSFPLENALTFLMPEFFGDTFHSLSWGRYLFWDMCGYCGIITLLLAAMALIPAGCRPDARQHIRLFAAGILIFTILALGSYTPLFALLYAHVPGFNFVRGNAKFIRRATNGPRSPPSSARLSPRSS